MKEITRKDLINALCDVLDGYNEYDIKDNTGMNIERCKEIMDIFNVVRKEWLKG